MSDYADARLPERFWDKTLRPAIHNGCWEWAAHRDESGYATFSVDGKTRRAHRVAYAALVGPIPEGLVCDHLCRVRHCVNPAHIELVSSRENTLRGAGTAPIPVGARFHRWTVLAAATPATSQGRLAPARCDCGTEALVSVKQMRNGDSRSCGCLRREGAVGRAARAGEKAPCPECGLQINPSGARRHLRRIHPDSPLLLRPSGRIPFAKESR